MHKQKSYLEKTEVHFTADKLYTAVCLWAGVVDYETSSQLDYVHVWARDTQRRAEILIDQFLSDYRDG